MRKRSRQDVNYDIGSDDLLSRLPDDILTYIISKYLHLKDAGRTSKVSKRWRYVWCQTLRLVFGDQNRLIDKTDYERINRPISWKERNQCVSWVTSVIRQHESSSIEEFRVHFNLDKKSKSAIDKWIEFSISKKAQILELDLRNNVPSTQNYEFPYEIFNERYWCSMKRQSYIPLDPVTNLVEIKFLKALILKDVNVNDEGLEKILRSCPILEHLHIYGSIHLLNPKIHGDYCSALKNVEIVSCFFLESVEILDSNIMSLSCVGHRPVTLTLHNLHKLEKISTGEFVYSWMEAKRCLPQISCYINYLQVLELNIIHIAEPVCHIDGNFFEMPNLKQLILHVKIQKHSGALMLTSFIEACPNLRRLSIQLLRLSDPWWRAMRIRRESWKMPKHRYQHLEVIEIFGYSIYFPSDLDLAMYFIDNCMALKKLVIDPSDHTVKATEEATLARETAARVRAKQDLLSIKPDGLDLNFL